VARGLKLSAINYSCLVISSGLCFELRVQLLATSSKLSALAPWLSDSSSQLSKISFQTLTCSFSFQALDFSL